MKTVLVIGSDGSMGRRYCAILRSLGVTPIRMDSPTIKLDLARYFLRDRDCDLPVGDGVIIASPTATHVEYVRGLALFGKPILCEKPFSTNLAEVEEMLRAPCPLDMMSQYVCLDPPHPDKWGVPLVGTPPPTAYDYYHSGSDGLIWDCLQLLGLARGPISLAAESPVWRCTLNGRVLSLDEVGRAYVDYVRRWLVEPEGNRARILEMHQKARVWAP